MNYDEKFNSLWKVTFVVFLISLSFASPIWAAVPVFILHIPDTKFAGEQVLLILD